MAKRKSRKTRLPKTSAAFSAEEIAVRSLVRRARLGIPQARDEITAKFYRMLWQMALKAAKRESDVEDFVNISYVFFADCIRTFDFRRGTKFITHCYARIPLQLLRLRADYAELIHIPAPAYLAGVRSPLLVSIHEKVRYESSDDLEKWFLAVAVADSADDFDRAAEIERLCMLIDELPTQERIVICGRIADRTLKSLGEEIGVSKSRVRQIESYGRRMLKCWMTGEELDSHLRARIRLQNRKLPVPAAG